MRAMVYPLAALALAVSAGGIALAGQKLGQVQPQRSPEELYPRTCGYCHGHNVGPIILGRQLPAAVVAAMVRHGRNAMPAFRPTEISPAELDALSHWVEASSASTQESGK